MKKQFVKPEMQRISLNFHENIVASEQWGSTGGYDMRAQNASTCCLVNTEYLYSQLKGNKPAYDAAYYCLNWEESEEQVAMMLGIEL